MEAIIFVCGIILVLIGYLAARIEFNKKLPALREKSYQTGFRNGFDGAMQNADAVRRAYIYHFETRK